MGFAHNRVDSLRVEERAWRFSGFARDARDGRLLWFEICGPESGSRSIVFRERSIVGRDREQCNCVIDDSTVSLKHAELIFERNRGLFLGDLNSTNGTFLNGRRLLRSERVEVNAGDTVHLGLFPLNVSYPR